MPKLNFARGLRWPCRSKEDIARDVDEEIAFHLEARTAELVGTGMEPAVARARAQREFGDIDVAREELRASDEAEDRKRRRLNWLDDLRQDLGLARRSLARDPGFAGAAIVVLTFGIGLAVAMFTVADAVLRRPLPVSDQDRVIAVWAEAEGAARRLPLNYALFERFREETRMLGEVAGTIHYGAWPFPMSDGSQTFSISVAPVTGNLFDVLGSRPALGRMLRPDDDILGAAPVAVISHGLWRSHYGSDPGVVGRRLTLNGRDRDYRVVGVAPPCLEYPAGTDLWVPVVPFTTYPGADTVAALIEPLGRLASGAGSAQAAGELGAFLVGERFGSWQPEQIRGVASPLANLVVGDVKPALLVLSAAAALLLLMACVNVANLLLVRATDRTEEIAVRCALGARRGRILRQLLTETSLLAVGGGVLGVALSAALVQGWVALAPTDLPRLEEVRLSGVSLAIAVGVTMAAVVIFGLVPALWTSGDVASPLNAGRSSTVSRGRRRTQSALVVLQVGLAIVVLTTGGLLGRSLLRLQRLDMGFATDGLAIVQLAWPWERYDGLEEVRALYDVLMPRIEALPAVSSASQVTVSPFAGEGGWDARFVGEGQSEQERDRNPLFNMEIVGSHYFTTFGLPVLRGRGFTDADREGSPQVAIVSEAVARLFWPDRDPLGKRVAVGQPTDHEDWWTVVGVVAETRYRTLRQPAPTVYFPYHQYPGGSAYIAVRANPDPASAVQSIRHAVREVDPAIAVTEAETMDGLVAAQLAQPRLNAVLLAAFAVSALLLAAIGLYAVLAFVVRQRTRELAIRHALGATPSRLRALVLRQAVIMAGAGAFLGLAAAVAGGRLLRSLLFGLSPSDPLTLAGVASVLLAVALAAAYVPARRATRADAVAVLRED